MKHLVLSLAVIFTCNFSLQAQSKAELAATLKHDLEDYRQYTLAGDFDKSIGYMPPKLFDLIPRDSLLALLRNSMENEHMSIQMSGFDYTDLQKIKIKKAGIYRWTYVPYEGKMHITLKGEAGYKKLMGAMMKSRYGSDNVAVESDSVITLALKKKQLIAFKEPGSSKWVLYEDRRQEGKLNDMEQMIFDNSIPEEIRKAVQKK